jgi:Flp pilus assembly protein protease CpaA
MLEIIAIFSLISAAALLIVLSVIDLRTWLLPNKYVAAFLCAGVVFHLCTTWSYLSPLQMIGGGAFALLAFYGLRALANWYYKDDALGLGDVKLMGAAGVWLGPHYILVAMIAGALAGVAHGLILATIIWARTKTFPNLNALALPAGPGFAAGIALAIVLMLIQSSSGALS